jgi:hypothetical protein
VIVIFGGYVDTDTDCNNITDVEVYSPNGRCQKLVAIKIKGLVLE